MTIRIIAAGGTIDKVYFDEKSAYQVGEPQVLEVLREANVTVACEVVSLLRKDSLEMTDDDRVRIREAVAADAHRHVVVTHGTDTMIQTARALQGLPGKTIVLTGAMQPARFRRTDAAFNIGCAVTAVQLLPEGVYIVMNGRVFRPERVRKNAERGCFEEVE